MVPDLHVLSKPVRYLLLGVLGSAVLLFAVLVLLGLASTPTVTVEATVVGGVPPDAAAEDVYPLSRFSADSPVRAAVEAALRSGSGSVETTTERYRAENVPTAFYVRHDGDVVRVSVDAGS